MPQTADAGKRLDFRIPDSDWFKLDLAQLLEGTHNEKLRFVSFILSRLVTIRARKSASIALSASCWKNVDNGLKNRNSWLSSAYPWILGKWFLTKIPDANMINTVSPRQLPCGTVYIETFRAVLVDESILSATREKGPNPFLCVAKSVFEISSKALWSMASKAALKSRRTRRFTFCLPVFIRI